MDTLRRSPAGEVPSSLKKEDLLAFYETMVLLRRFELTAQSQLKKGEMPGFIHLYVGEEATATGVCAHLRPTDWITSTHRGHGHVLAKGMPPKILMAELHAKATGCCGGRGGTMHLYSPAIGLFGTNGIVSGSIPHAVGAALGAKVRGADQVAVAFFGDGASSHGSFHESLNFAGIQRAPVIFVCENNLYATATPLAKATRNPEIATKAAAHGIPGVAVDGNDVLAVWQVAREAVARARRGEGPTLIESKTYRTVGHHEGDPVVGVYRTQEEIDAWKRRCPILLFRRKLVEELKIAAAAELDAIEARVEAVLKEAVEFARSSPEPDPATWPRHVFADPIHPSVPVPAASPQTVTKGWLDAVSDGIAEEMRRDPHIVYLGEGIGERPGTFGHTKGLWQEFGGGRVIDTPISELGFTGAAIGLSATGCRAVADLMFSDFIFESGGQVPLQAAKIRYMSNGQMSAPMVVRAPCGAVRCAGPHHSGMYSPVWAHIPGLIVVMPSNPADAKGLFKTALRAGDPVLFLEPKALFQSRGDVPAGEHLVPFGVARVVREGRQLTLVAVGPTVPLSLEAAQALEAEGISCDVIDLRTIVPMDVNTIAASLKKTGRLLVVDEAWATCGIGAEVTAAMMEVGFDDLDAPIGRLHMEPVTHPFSPPLEAEVLPTVEKIVAAAKGIMAGRAPVQRRPRSPVAPAETALRPSAPPGPSRPPEQPAAATPDSPRTLEKPAAAAAVLAGEPITMPHGDLTVDEGRVVRWRKAVGETVAKGETVVEVETDKAVVEIEAPASGTLAQILAPVEAVVKMGHRLGVIQPS
jgi:2-oxoisovalerate dehydrogenase E1 component